MIYIGNQTACWAATPNEPFDYALARGFDAFEWFPDKKPGAGWDERDLNQGSRQNIRQIAGDRGMRLSVHARWQANPLAPDSHPLLWMDLQLACDLGAALLNIHLFHEQGMAVFVEAIKPLMHRVAEAGLQLAIENTPQHSPEQFNELFAHLRELGSAETGHVGMCLDIGHANLCSATRNDYLGFCDRLDPQVPILHLHLHENWGDADTHLPLFTGPAARDDSGVRGLLSRLKRRQFSGSAILEQWPHPPSLLDHARSRLLKMWEAPDPDSIQGNTSAPLILETKTTATAVGDFPAALVAGDRRCRSWREKLDFARDLLTTGESAPTKEQLIDVAIYLRFLGTGEIVCEEDGRHFRPAHHARIASQIQERLATLATPETAYLIRKIYPWLPSSAPTFRRPEPLTRIRDIAHRNDIGRELKREIKTTLQNKLHRCAGPEDLATSAALLQRITAPGANYPPAFVEQFKTFHEELKEFFNARSLDERLLSLTTSVDADQAESIQFFLRQKGDSPGSGAGALPGKQRNEKQAEAQSREEDAGTRLAAFRTLTALRLGFQERLLRKAGVESQELLLADIGLEDFAFVLLSEIINAADGSPPGRGWGIEIEALMLGLKNLGLSGIDPGECGALEAELRMWGAISPAAGRDELLRVKATLLRCRRLAEDFSARILELFSGRVEQVGHLLGVAEHAIRVFSESDIRGHIIFQVSKLVAGLLRRLRERLGSPGWDVLVSGRAVGRVKVAASLDALAGEAHEPVLVLLRSAAGDEEIPKNVAGIVLAQELPHLSHLGVRARQAGIVVAACEEALELERLKAFEGRKLSFVALPDHVAWEESGAQAGATRSDQAGHPCPGPPPLPRLSPQIPPVRLATEKTWIPLEAVVAATGGGKATGARRLAELAGRAGSGFDIPASFVVPFGVMEAALATTPVAEAEYRRLVERLDGMLPEEIAAAAERLKELVQQLPVPAAIVSEASRRFRGNVRLMVRSSANCEDLEEFAGAGLYESVMNVVAADLASAIRVVWSSLWTRRAALSRQQAGIAHAQAHMAVLVQEMLLPECAFVLHTVNPITHQARELYAEIVVGLGDTLASAATRGSPFRLVCDKDSGAVTTLAFANFSQASRPDPSGGLRKETVDYSQISLSREAGARTRLGQRLARIGRLVEEAMTGPQDIEGVVVQAAVYLVQTRPQPGLPAPRAA